MKHAFSLGITRRIRVCTAVALVVPALFANAAPPASRVELDISKFTFAPKEINVAPGTTLVWTNRDDSPHTVASDDKSFKSKGLDTGDKFEHKFDREGDFNYICTVHPFMTGVVHVHKQ